MHATTSSVTIAFQSSGPCCCSEGLCTCHRSRTNEQTMGDLNRQNPPNTRKQSTICAIDTLPQQAGQLRSSSGILRKSLVQTVDDGITYYLAARETQVHTGQRPRVKHITTGSPADVGCSARRKEHRPDDAAHLPLEDAAAPAWITWRVRRRVCHADRSADHIHRMKIVTLPLL